MTNGWSYRLGQPKPQARPEAAEPQVAKLFETPVIVDTMPNAPSLNEALKAVILAKRERDSGVLISNEGGGWHSRTDMLSWGGEPAEKLLQRVIRSADRFTTDIRSQGEPRFRWYPEMWANVSAKGASNAMHAHPGSFYSAVYYVDDGYDGSSDAALGGELVLMDPRMPGIAMNSPDLRFTQPGGEPAHWEAKMRPAAGRIVMFPSWLNHSVRPYLGDGLRISIAINLTAIPVATAASS